MPLNVFDAIRPTISTLLGGAGVDLRAGEDETKTGEGRLLQPVTIEGKRIPFCCQAGCPYQDELSSAVRVDRISGLYSGSS